MLCIARFNACNPGIYQVNVGSSVQSSEVMGQHFTGAWALNLLQGELLAHFIV